MTRQPEPLTQETPEETAGTQQRQEPVTHEAPSTPAKEQQPGQKKQKVVLSETSRRIGTEAALKGGGGEMMTLFLEGTMPPATTAPAAAATTTKAPCRPGACRFFPKGTCRNGEDCTYSH